MDAGVLFGAVRTRVDRGGLLHGEADRGWRLELSGLAVDPAVAESAKSGLLTGRPGRLGVARNADFFPHDGRQAIPGNSAPKALDTHHLLASPALWWVTT